MSSKLKSYFYLFETEEGYDAHKEYLNTNTNQNPI